MRQRIDYARGRAQESGQTLASGSRVAGVGRLPITPSTAPRDVAPSRRDPLSASASRCQGDGHRCWRGSRGAKLVCGGSNPDPQALGDRASGTR